MGISDPGDPIFQKKEFDLSVRDHTIVAEEDLIRYMQSIPAMFWRINLVKNRIDFLNDFSLPVLGLSARQLLQNKEYSRQVIVADDHLFLENFLEDARNRRNSLVIVRAHRDSEQLWLKIVGAPDADNFNFYHGYIMDVSAAVGMIQSRTSHQNLYKERIEMFDYPVLLIQAQNHNVYGINQAARDLLNVHDEKVNFYQLLYQPDLAHFHSIYEHLLFQQSWQGKINFSIDGTKVKYQAKIRTLYGDGHNLLWISLQKPAQHYVNGTANLQSSEVNPKMMEELIKWARQGDMSSVLDKLLEMQPEPRAADGLIYSQVLKEQGLVRVWGRGSSWEKLEPGAKYPYSGTIAENIESYKLPFLIVEETLESIKPIDWALFIPHQVHSYIAIPLYHQEVMHTVLIFTAAQARGFAEFHFRYFQYSYSLFSKLLPDWLSTQNGEAAKE